jgi:hypothetical protein
MWQNKVEIPTFVSLSTQQPLFPMSSSEFKVKSGKKEHFIFCILDNPPTRGWGKNKFNDLNEAKSLKFELFKLVISSASDFSCEQKEEKSTNGRNAFG